MKGKKIVALLVLIIFAIGVYLFIQYKKTHISTDDAYITNTIYWVNPRVSGIIKKVFVDDNEFVKKGEVIATIDSKPFKIAYRKAQANVEVYKAKINEAKAKIQAAQSEIELTNAQLDKATWDFNRAKRLFKKGVISKDVYEKYLTSFKVLKAKLKAKEDVLNQAKVGLISLKRALKLAESQMSLAKLDLSYTEIKAPHSGFITKKSVEEGKFVAPSLPICAIVPKEGAWIVANYKESQLYGIRVGERVKISIDAYPGKTFYGRVQSIQFGTGEVFSLFPPQNASGNWIKVVQRVPVKIVFTKPPEVPLRVGMSCETVVYYKDGRRKHK